MPRKNTWGTIEIEPAKVLVSLYEGVITWHTKPPSNVMKRPSVPTGEGEYANRSEGHKLYSKARRRVSKFAMKLLSVSELPDWLITLNYPHKQARTLTPGELKRDLDCFRKFVKNNYPGAGVAYLIDFSKEAKHHIHAFVWGLMPKSNAEQRVERTKLRVKIRRWWYGRVGSRKRNLTKVDYLPTDEDSMRMRSYLTNEKKVKAHMQVVLLLGQKHSFGFFQKGNVPLVSSEPVEMSEEEFEEIRDLLLPDLKKGKGRKASKKRQQRKLKTAKAHRHIFHDRRTVERINKKLRKRTEE